MPTISPCGTSPLTLGKYSCFENDIEYYVARGAHAGSSKMFLFQKAVTGVMTVMKENQENQA